MKKNGKTNVFCRLERRGRALVGNMLLLAMIASLWSSPVYAQQTNSFSLTLQQASVLDALREINRLSGNAVVFKREEVERITQRVTVNLNGVTALAAVEACIKGTMLSCEMLDGKVVVVPQRGIETKVITGRVVDDKGVPLPGATVVVKGVTPAIGVATNSNGEYRLTLPGSVTTLAYSFIGYATKEVSIEGKSVVDVVLQEDVQDIGDVIVTGVYTRKAESYTGAARTITSTELTRVGNQNLFQSLKNLDPTLNFIDNLDLGSNPNAMPQLQMRGTTSFPLDEAEISLKGNYQNKPNQPLFILDGFEASVESIFDLYMNRVESVTILKDASAKALYGSKAANGVVVVTTKRLAGDELILTYNGNIQIEAPDLSSYNLANAAEKLEAERIDGVYDETSQDSQIDLWNLYNARRKLILEGLDTYWLSKPLRTGVGQKHTLSVEVGDARNLRASMNISYNNVDGVMKGSYRNTISGNVNISYRLNNLLFRNVISIVSMKNEESPYGSFSEYTKLNPYWRATDPETGNISRWAELGRHIPNPMYDALIGTLDRETYLNFTNNFYIEWNITPHVKTTGRVGISNKRSDAEKFLPADHSKFSNYSYMVEDEEIRMRRGSYEFENGKSSSVNFDLMLAYNNIIGRHNISADAKASISEYVSKAYRHKAEGFPSNMGADITFAKGYALGSRPEGITSLQRELSFLVSANYDYNSRYLMDVNYRIGASSLYGKDNRWAPGWGVGIGWNIHNEEFLANSDFLQRLKLRASIGVTGNQNFNTNMAITTYKYYTNNLYMNQVGSYMAGLANPDLGWERRKDYNIGLDMIMKGFTATVEYYKGITLDALENLYIPQSTGFERIKDNVGRVSNTGMEFNLGYTIFQRKEGFLTIFGSVVTEKNILEKVSETMRAYNEMREQMAADRGNPKPVLMYRDGQAMNTIWAVPSLGIDPMTGNEIYVKQDGSLTYTYDPLDLVASGNKDPKYRGNFGFNAEYKGVGINMTCRYLGGGEMYNETLVDRVENIDIDYNVDRRVLLGRWKTPGQHAQFKRLGTFTYTDNPAQQNEKTRATTRFVQKRDEFDIASINVYYDVPLSMLQSMGIGIKRLKLAGYMNDVYKWSSIRIERGLSYPYSHTFSFSLTATF